MILPLLSAIGVLAIMYSNRFGDRNEIFGDPAVAQHIVPSLLAAIRSLPIELAGIRSAASRYEQLIWGPVPKFLLFVGVALTFLGMARTLSPRQVLALILLACAVLGAALLSSFASFYQFGTNCCARHQSMRESFGALVIFIAAIVLVGLPTLTPNSRSRIMMVLGLGCVGVSALLAGLPNWPRTLHSIARFEQVRETMASNWLSGRSASGDMTYIQRGDSYSGDPTSRLGEIHRADADLWTGRMMDYFGKQRVIMVPPIP